MEVEHSASQDGQFPTVTWSRRVGKGVWVPPHFINTIEGMASNFNSWILLQNFHHKKSLMSEEY